MTDSPLLDALKAAIPDARDFIDLPAEALAGFLLEAIKTAGLQPGSSNIHLWNDLGNGLARKVAARWTAAPGDMVRAVLEAWGYLVGAGCIALDAADMNKGTYFVTRRGTAIATPADFNAFRAAQAVPRAALHPAIAEVSWPPFIRAQYSMAVFGAFHAVEVAVRDAAGYGAEKHGLDMMREAFRPGGGPLSDAAALPAEQEAVRNLFTGAFGAYRNAHGHRRVELTDPVEVGELLFLASHLMRIVDTRAAAHPAVDAEAT